MAVMKQWLVEEILDHLLRAEEYEPPSSVWLALYLTAPTATTNGIEMSGSGYARQQITFDPALDGESAQAAEIEFPTATGNWGDIEAWAICTAQTGGRQMFFHEFTPTTVSNGDVVRFQQGAIVVKQAS